MGPGMSPEDGANMRLRFNRFDDLSRLTAKAMTPIPTDDSNPPPNIHGNKVFLCKFQVITTEVASPSSMLVYDRKRSFEAHLLREGMEGVFGTFVREIRDPRSALPGLKVCRWIDTSNVG